MTIQSYNCTDCGAPGVGRVTEVVEYWDADQQNWVLSCEHISYMCSACDYDGEDVTEVAIDG